ncbi:hypothetical protein Tcan_07353 [Toxocara canis]|uniref:Transmembrane protein n=1 Tax=Toxocara canis TaxID=6265 RepID=A0A0B2VV50_TOXCA|nr:hypothetical protein Tcan_07353 [Toxocara canis]
MGEAYEALGPVEDKAPPPISPAAAPPAADATGNAGNAETKPSSNAGQENADFGVVSGYISHSSGAQGNNPDNSDSSQIRSKTKKKGRTRTGTALLVFFGLFLGVSAIGTIGCILLMVSGVELP